MVEINKFEGYVSEKYVSCFLLMSCTFIIISIFGIKFRYRMNISNSRETSSSSVLIRSSSVIGRYSQISGDNNNTSNYTPPPTLSSFNVKSENIEQKKIFKWPFKKLTSRNPKNLDQNTATAECRGKNIATNEKNERLIKSIHERLNYSASMPDLLNRNDIDNSDKKEIKFLTGIEVVDDCTQFVTVDEMKMPKRPIRIKMRRAPAIPVHETRDKISLEENEVKKENLESSLQQIPPLIVPRKSKNHKYLSIDSIDDTPEQTATCDPLKSILKTRNENISIKTQHDSLITKTQHITFVDIPDDSSSSSSDFDKSENVEEEDDDIWTRINIHRNQLKRLQEIEDISRENEAQDNEGEEIPPLPKTPPPLINEQSYLRDFSFV